jgi:hypothetical protein
MMSVAHAVPISSRAGKQLTPPNKITPYPCEMNLVLR